MDIPLDSKPIKKHKPPPPKPLVVYTCKADYIKITQQQQEMKCRWMANEDYNICLYVQENGTKGMKK